MNKTQPTYEELEVEIQEAREQIQTLYHQEADAIVGSRNVSIVRSKEVEEQIQQARRTLEAEFARRTAEVEELRGNLQNLLKENRRMARDLRRGETALLEKADRLRKMTHQLGQAEERERKHLAAILHDDIQQILVGAKFHLECLASSVNPDGMELFREVKSILHQAIDKTRTLSHELNPPILQQAGLIAALQWLTENVRAIHCLTIDSDFQPVPEPEDRQIKAFIFRAVRELLFNIAKHAGVDRAQLIVRQSDHCFTVTVCDQGRGFDVSRLLQGDGTGMGISDISERANTLGGELVIESTPGQGSRFTLRVPCAEA